MAEVHGAVPAAGASTLDRHRLGVMLFLASALISFVLSVTLWFTDNHPEALFVGLWVPSILAAGTFWALVAVRPR